MLSSVKSLFKSLDAEQPQSVILSPEQRLVRLQALQTVLERKPDFKVGDFVFVDPEAVDLGLSTDRHGELADLPSCGYVLRLQVDSSFEGVKRIVDNDSEVLLAVERRASDEFYPPIVFRKFDHRLFRKMPEGSSPSSRELLKFANDSPVNQDVAPGTIVRVRAGHRICDDSFSKMYSSMKTGVSTSAVQAPLVVLGFRENANEKESFKQPLTLAYFADDACHVGRTVVVQPYEVCLYGY